MSHSERRSTDERRVEIADAALRIIATRGITALTVANLAKELGLTGGALYRHFPSTEAILEAVALRVVELMMQTIPDPSLPPLEWLEKFVESRSRTIGGHKGLVPLLFSEQLAMALPEPALETLRTAVKSSVKGIERALTEAQARGDVRTDIPAVDLAPIVVGAVMVLTLSRSGELLPRVTTPARSWETLRTLLTCGDSKGPK